jgi:hypothetical protein
MPRWLLAISDDTAAASTAGLASGTATLQGGAATVAVVGMPDTARIVTSYRFGRATSPPLMLSGVAAGTFTVITQDGTDSFSSFDWIASW